MPGDHEPGDLGDAMHITGANTPLSAQRLVSVRSTPFDERHGVTFLDLNLAARPEAVLVESLRGPGLYAMGFYGRVAYVGSFLGEFKKKGDPYAGCIVQSRWHRHLATLTCRGHKVSSRRSCVPTMLARYPESELLQALMAVNDSYCGRQGYEASKMRLRFTHHFWGDFSTRDARNLLDGFEYVYLRVSPGEANGSPKRITAVVDEAERLAIAAMLPVVNDRKLPRQYHRTGIPWREPSEWTRLEDASALLRRALLDTAAAMPAA